MTEKRGNIDNWLKTAAQQPGPGLDPGEEEEGWAGLSAMLDDDRKRPGIIAGGTGFVSSLRRRRWLILSTAALIVFLTLSLYLSKHFPDTTRPSSSNALTTATPGKTNNTAPNRSGGITQQAPTPPSGTTIQDEESAEQVAGAVVGDVAGQPPASETMQESLRPHRQSVQHQQPVLQQVAAPSAQKEPDQVESIKANGLSLQTLPLLHGYGLSLSRAGQHLLTAPSAKATVVHYPRWAIQAGFLVTNDAGRGARVSFMYRVPIRKHLYLQPYIGAGYTGNYDKTLRHFGLQPVVDGSGQSRTDSVWTTYRVKSGLSADAGIRIGYTLDRFSFGTGFRYHHILHSTGDSSSVRKWGGAPSGNMVSQTFSKANVPGKHSFYGELEANYQWRFGLTAGVSYQFLMHESASPAWQPPVYNSSSSNSTNIPGLPDNPGIKNSLQDKGRLEVYIRLPLGRK